MPLRRLLLAALAGLLVAAAVVGTTPSGASYVAATTYDASVGAATDWTPPTVSVTNPGTLVSGDTTISATASDARGTVTSVVVQHAPAGTESWTTLCTDTTSPYSCPWTTTSVADAAYDLRAVATDDAGYSTTSATVTTRVANNASVVLGDPGEVVRGQKSLTAAVSALPGGAKYVFSYAPAGTTTWTTICAQAATFTASTTCAWNTTPLTGEYDVRVVATSTSGSTYTDTAFGVIVDNTAPTGVSLTVPVGPLRGTVGLTATADDADSGIATVAIQTRRQGAATWTTCGTSTAEPYTCQFVTTAVVDGTYELRSVATDLAGNETSSVVVVRTVDNTVSSVSVTSPAAGATVRGGAVSLTAAASSNRGVTSVRIEVKPTAGATWAAVCTTAAAPYTCSWNTSAIVADSYDVRAVLLDGSGATTISATVTVRVDNTVLRAVDVQTVNGGILRKPDAGDRLVLTYSARVNLATVKPGWTGAATTIAPVLRDRAATGSVNASRDNLTLPTTNLGSVSFAQNFLGNRRSVTFAGSTMVASEQLVDGVAVTVVTITLGTANGTVSTRAATGAMIWSPTALVQTPAGQASSTGPATESGVTDADF